MISIQKFTNPPDNFKQLKKMRYELSGVKNVLRYHNFVAYEVHIKQKQGETFRSMAWDVMLCSQ